MPIVLALAALLLCAPFELPLVGGSLSGPAPVPPDVLVPFGCGRAYPVSQAHETGSHLQNDSWAWDFRMPEGVEIVAALDGAVRLARGDSKVGGCDPKFASQANYVVLAHEDGWETQYLHFSKVVVAPGQNVKAGELLGYSGKTGWACGSHLHFKVARREGDGWNNPSVRARIVGYGDPVLDTLVEARGCSNRAPLIAEKNAKAPAAPSAAHGASDAPHTVSPTQSAPAGGAAPGKISPASSPPSGVKGGTGAPKPLANPA